MPVGLLCRRQHKPIEAVRRQSQKVGQLADGRKKRSRIEFDRNAAGELRKVELNRLRTVRYVGDAQYRVVLVWAQIRQYLAVLWIEQGKIATSEGRMTTANG